MVGHSTTVHKDKKKKKQAVGQLKKFYKKAITKDSSFSIEPFYPTPKGLDAPDGLHDTEIPIEKRNKLRKLWDVQKEVNIKKHGHETWYDWRIENWGTKWEVTGEEDYYDEGDYVSYWFDSAWAPPSRAILEISKQFPLLSFGLKFEEPGCQFMGSFKCEGGKITQDECIDYGA